MIVGGSTSSSYKIKALIGTTVIAEDLLLNPGRSSHKKPLSAVTLKPAIADQLRNLSTGDNLAPFSEVDALLAERDKLFNNFSSVDLSRERQIISHADLSQKQ